MADWLKSILATDAAFVFCSLAALTATIIVAAGLILEYERHELIGLSKKQIGGFLVVAGVTLEAVFGLGAFVSASIREARLESELIEVQPRAAQLRNKDAADRFVKTLKPFGQQKIAIIIWAADDEALREELAFGFRVAPLLAQDGWVDWNGQRLTDTNSGTRYWKPPASDAIPHTGLEVEVSDHAGKAQKEAASALSTALKSAHLETFMNSLGREQRLQELSKYLNVEDPNVIFLNVGIDPKWGWP